MTKAKQPPVSLSVFSDLHFLILLFAQQPGLILLHEVLPDSAANQGVPAP